MYLNVGVIQCQTQTSINPCDSNPCLNGGQCVNSQVDNVLGYTCQCATDYYGVNCRTYYGKYI